MDLHGVFTGSNQFANLWHVWRFERLTSWALKVLVDHDVRNVVVYLTFNKFVGDVIRLI